jgi:hypothetical protein
MLYNSVALDPSWPNSFCYLTIRAKKLCLKKTVIGHAISAISQDKGLKIQTEA